MVASLGSSIVDNFRDQERRKEMRVRELSCFLVDIPAAEGEYVMSRGRVLETFPSVIVKITAEDGTTGYGEAATLGANYLDGFPASVRETVRLLAPWVLECDVFAPGVLVEGMDARVRGHLPGKAAIDVAFWDLRAKLLGVTVAQLLGGAKQRTLPGFYAVSLAAEEDMVEAAKQAAARGFRGWQLKIGSDDPIADARRAAAIVAAVGDEATFVTNDANAGWTPAQALRFVGATAGIDAYLEQPCPTIAEMAHVRAAANVPMLMDESIVKVGDMLGAAAARIGEAVNIKPVKVGGLTKAARIRDIAEAAGWMVLVDEAQGADIGTATVASLAATVEPANLLAAAYFMGEEMRISYQSSRAATGPQFVDGTVAISDEPGLGVTIDDTTLGTPAFTINKEDL
jgi:L-alanine-DL-glutamate epimerase-like enolase superfamily enzyme